MTITSDGDPLETLTPQSDEAQTSIRVRRQEAPATDVNGSRPQDCPRRLWFLGDNLQSKYLRTLDELRGIA
jgi:hypothetical protein